MGIKIILSIFTWNIMRCNAWKPTGREIMALFQSIAEQFKIPLWDYSDSILSQQRNFFNNSEHLNAGGAEIFSKDLSQRLIEEFPQLNTKQAANESPSDHLPVPVVRK